jgi:Glycosyltransferase family 87
VRRNLDAHAVLGAGVVAAVVLEAGYDSATSDVWLFAQAAVAAAALLYAWRRQERLRLVPVLVLAAAFQLAWVTLHAVPRYRGGYDLDSVSVRGDVDTKTIFPREGQRLVHGHYPHSEYPVGAVLLFALEAWIAPHATRTFNAFLMVPFQLVTVAAVWLTRTRYAPWLAALLAFWPLNAFSWEFKFDLVPAALLALGLVLALHERWGWSGIVLGVGALAKWTPGLAFVPLLAWLLVRRRGEAAARHAIAFAATVALVYVPFLVWNAHDVLAAYTRQGKRTITPESVWFLPLRHLFGDAHVRTHISESAGAPHWANVAAGVIQAALVVVLVALAARAPTLRRAVALAALAPAAFLISNRIFSPQFLVPLFAAWAIAAALVARSSREQLAAGALATAASFANAFVYPFALPRYDVTWQLASLVLFACAVALTAWLAVRSSEAARPAPG